jgi:hypothetical protein
VTTKKSGAPVPLARIELSPLVPSDQTAIVQADLEGRFRFGGLKPGKYTAIARADGLAPAAASWVEVPGADLDLRMTEGAFVEGHVVNADGSPAEGAELSSSPNESVLSVEHGAFSMQVSPGRPRLVVRGRHAAAVLQLPFVAPGTTLHNVVVRLAPGASISGVVVGGEPKAPAVGAAVSVTPAGTSEPIARQTSGAGGAFSFGALPPGIYDVSASAAARGRGSKRGLVVEQGAHSEVQLDLFPEAGVHGVVRDDEGKPVPGAIVKEAWGPKETVSGADGSYSLTGFTSDHVWLLAMRSRDEDGDSESIELPAGAEVERDLWVQRNGILTGSVRFASGQQLPADLQVHAMRTTPFFASRAVAIGSTSRYRLSLPPGSYQIAAVGDMSDREKQPLALVAAGTETTFDVVVPGPAGDLGVVDGVVLEPDGAPSPGAEVFLRAADTEIVARVTAGDDGAFHVEPLSGAPVVAAAFNGGRSGSASLDGSSGPVLVRLGRAASLSGRLIAARVPESFEVISFVRDYPAPMLARSWQSWSPHRFTGDHFRLDDLLPGKRTVSITTDDGRFGETSVVLKGGDEGEVTIDLQPTASLAGRVVSYRSHQPVALASVELDGRGSKTDETGRFTFDDVSGGEHWLSVSHSDRYWVATRTLSLSAAQVVDLGDVELQPPQTPPGAIGIYPAALDNEIVIDHVIEGSPAESAGLLQGDVITRVDDVKVRTPDELRQQVIGTPGTPVRLSVRRAGVTSFVTVVRAPKTVQ